MEMRKIVVRLSTRSDARPEFNKGRTANCANPDCETPVYAEALEHEPICLRSNDWEASFATYFPIQ
jgi:hypothetical protein